MGRSRWVRAGSVVLTAFSFVGVAYAHSGGVTGKSGKQGSTCSQCHNGGTTPKVSLSGPTSLDAGMSAIYTFQLITDASITGMNAATSDGVLVGNPDGGATKTEDKEITHTRTLKPDAGIALYSFSMTAPEFGGKVTLFAAGNACNNDGQTTGDEPATAKLEIDVSGPPKPPPPEAGPPPTPTATATATSPPPVPAADSGSSVDVDAGAEPAAKSEDDSGCSIGWADRSSMPAGALLGALLGLAAVLRGRRR